MALPDAADGVYELDVEVLEGPTYRQYNLSLLLTSAARRCCAMTCKQSISFQSGLTESPEQLSSLEVGCQEASQ